MSKGKIIEILNADIHYGIGKRNGLLFHLPLDMAYFRSTTLNHTVVMGENTLLSFPGGKPLKNRTNIVLSADPTHNYKNVWNVHSLAQLYAIMEKTLQNENIFIIGGASIYRQMLPFTNQVLLTKVHADGHAEVFYENLDEKKEFRLVKEGENVMDGDIEISFCEYENTAPLPLPKEEIEGAHHEWTLYNGPFLAMQSGKDIEMRLYDDKRKALQIGDTIAFTNRDTGEKLTRKVLALAPFDSFETLYAAFPKTRLGYKESEEAKPSDMETYYSKEAIEKFGPLAILLSE